MHEPSLRQSLVVLHCSGLLQFPTGRQREFRHSCPDEHTVPQAPQLLVELVISTQEPLQRVDDVGQTVAVTVDMIVAVEVDLSSVVVDAVMPAQLHAEA